MTDADYEARSDRYADPNEPLQATMGESASGEDAAAKGRDFLLGEFGSDEAIEDAIRAGRPRVDGSKARGESLIVRGRVPDHDAAALALLAARTGRTQSDLVREAVHELLERNRLIAS